ncbi:MAG: S-layer family protein, partial [Cyanobacteria bacterium P01_D01_bin.50]
STQIVDSNNEQATINIDARDLILRRGSNIFTNAEGENVQGGNINIDSSVIVALQNSDISANSAEGRGGNINIEAQGIFGTQFREETSDESDITATGANSELSGSVEINGLEQNPAEVLTELPDSPIEGEFYNACQVGTGENASEFYIVGKGGIPPSPLDLLQEESLYGGWVSLPESLEGGEGVEGVEGVEGRRISTRSLKPQNRLGKFGGKKIYTPNFPQNPIVEATGMIVDENGDILFVAQASPQSTPSFNNKSCVKK